MNINNQIVVDNNQPLVVIGGMNVIESIELAFRVCDEFCQATQKLDMPYIFKASFDKANRSSVNSFRGPGLEKGLNLLYEIKKELKVPIITDIHEPYQAKEASQVCDVLQLPAFLARQTDLIAALASTKKPIHIKKPPQKNKLNLFY